MKTSDMIFMGKDFFSDKRGNIETLRIPVENSFTEPRIEGEGAVLDNDTEKK